MKWSNENCLHVHNAELIKSISFFFIPINSIDLWIYEFKNFTDEIDCIKVCIWDYLLQNGIGNVDWISIFQHKVKCIQMQYSFQLKSNQKELIFEFNIRIFSMNIKHINSLRRIENKLQCHHSNIHPVIVYPPPQ